MTKSEKAASVRVGHSLAGSIALGSIVVGWLLWPVYSYFETQYVEESAKAVPHTVPKSFIDAISTTAAILFLATLILGIVGFLQGRRKQATAIAALAMFCAALVLMWIFT